MSKITPFLWFDDNAEEAANFYVSLFPGSKITGSNRYDEASAKAAGRPVGSVLTVSFVLDGQDFVALNGGPEYKFSEATSFVVSCADQAEIDRYWDALTAGGGEEGPCGWCKDKFGLSWQVVPAELDTLISGPDPEGSKRAMSALMQMKKLDLEALRGAYGGR